jgi:16S rRNA processing protein RimM
VGRLLKAHGLKGAIKLELYTDSPNERFVPGAVLKLQVPETSPWFGKTVTVKELRWYNNAPVIFLENIDDRTAAETLIRAILLIDTDTDAKPAEDDAWYDYQLVGLDVMRDGVSVGKITRVDHLPAQDLLAVAAANGEVLVPFVKAIVTSVDVAAGTVTVNPPLGLFEEIEDDTDVSDAVDASDATDATDASGAGGAE